VRLGAQPDADPISTSRPRGNEEIPHLNKPPADMVAAVEAAKKVAEPEPTAKTPPVVASEPLPAARAPLPTLLSAAESGRPAQVTHASDLEDEGPAMSQPAPSVGPRSVSGAPGARRKGRGSNLRKSTAPPSMTDPGRAAAVVPTETTTAPVPVKEASAEAAAPAPVAAAAETEAAPAAQHASPAEEAAPRSKETPASAVPASDLDQRFFDHGDRGPHEAPHSSVEDIDYDERLAHKNTPEAIARRERFGNVIKYIAGGCVFLMVVGLVRSRMAPVEEPAPRPVVVTVAPPPPPPKVEVAPPAASVAVVVPAESAAPEASGSAAPGASGSAAPVASGAIPVTSTDDLPAAPAGSGLAPIASGAASAKAPGVDLPGAPAAPAVPLAEPTEAEKKSAAQEKRNCAAFLDQGAFAKSVEAGERSVALDPTDGEAWLTLGAAYQSMGKGAEARRSYASCVAEGKRGPINECRAMLR
jgi:tetratricopeptide (TPR) repeat protein